MSIIKIVSHVSLHKLTCFMRQRVAPYRSDPCMLPVVSLITSTCKARVCLISFAIKTYLLLHRKKTFLYTNAHFNSEDGSRKIMNLEWGNGIPERSTESNINDRKIFYKNSLTLKCAKHFHSISDNVDVYHKDKPVRK